MWIEMLGTYAKMIKQPVILRVRVWIEIAMRNLTEFSKKSPASKVGG